MAPVGPHHHQDGGPSSVRHQIILNGQRVRRLPGHKRHLSFTKEDNCFTQIADAADLAGLQTPCPKHGCRAPGPGGDGVGSTRRASVFALSIREQERTGFRYAYSVFKSNTVATTVSSRQSTRPGLSAHSRRTRARLDVRQVRTLFGANGVLTGTAHAIRRLDSRLWFETLAYDLTVFKIHFGNLTLKAYTKGEHVLRVERPCITRTTEVGRVVDRFLTSSLGSKASGALH